MHSKMNNSNIQEHSFMGCSFRLWLIGLLIISLLVACQPDATPVANLVPPTQTADISETLAPPIRYVLGTHAQQMKSIQTEIAQSALLIPASGLTEASLLGADYDVIADYGIVEGWQQSPVTPTVSLVINPSLAPMQDDTASHIIRVGIDGLRIINQTNISGTRPLAISNIQTSSLKTELANMGYPDGFELTIYIAEIPNHQAIIDELNTLNIDLNINESTLEEIAQLLVENRIHLALIKWHTVAEKSIWTATVGETNVIDLYQLPISYIASPDLNITFADNGFPIASY